MSKEITYWTSVLKKILSVIAVLLGIWIICKLAYFYLPFLVAFIIAIIMEPFIKFLMNKLKLNRKISSILIFILTFGIILGSLIWGVSTLISESTNLLNGLSGYYYKAYNQIQNLINRFNFNDLKMSNQIIDIIKNILFNMLENASNWIQTFFTNLLSNITKLPVLAIYFGVTIVSLYFLCTDRIYMLDELEHHLPQKWVKKLSAHIRELIKVLGGYLKAQITLILISFCICLIGLYILYFLNWNIEYPLVSALGIAFVDALPILGSGTVMFPWAIILSLNGNIKPGIAIIVLWIIMSVTRQLIEPKIVSSQIGIHPIFTIIAMYTGFKFLGVLGMFAGPIILIIIKNIFSNFIDNGIIKTILESEE